MCFEKGFIKSLPTSLCPPGQRPRLPAGRRSGSETKGRRNASPFEKACLPVGRGDCRRPIGPLARREEDLGYYDILIIPLFQKTKVLQIFIGMDGNEPPRVARRGGSRVVFYCPSYFLGDLQAGWLHIQGLRTLPFLFFLRTVNL